MKVFRNKLTGRLGETQFGEESEVLIRNAKSAGFKDAEIEIIEMTPEEYKEAIAKQDFNELDYRQKRAREYPDYREYLDAKVKQASTDQTMKNEGIAQEQKYLSDCLAIKAKYPKS